MSDYMKLRKIIGKITSPIFVPLRKFIVWGDSKFGTCDMKLSLEPRWIEPTENNDFKESQKSETIASELMKKVSKDKANLVSYNEGHKKSIGQSFPPTQLLNILQKSKKSEE
jgi:hypothetical protein